MDIRRYDIDSLRVLAFALLILVHVGNFLDSKDWLIKNSVTYGWLDFPQWFFSQWRLSLLFVVSGMGTFFNFSKRNGWGFVKERFVRLFVPLVVGMLIIVPPMVYLERLDTGQFLGSFFDFWPSKAFTGKYPEGNVSWHHLWFVVYLLFFSLLLTPAFLYLRKNPQAWIVRQTKRSIHSTSCIWLSSLFWAIISKMWKCVLLPNFLL